MPQRGVGCGVGCVDTSEKRGGTARARDQGGCHHPRWEGGCLVVSGSEAEPGAAGIPTVVREECEGCVCTDHTP